jgi:hypothetical protein
VTVAVAVDLAIVKSLVAAVEIVTDGITFN